MLNLYYLVFLILNAKIRKRIERNYHPLLGINQHGNERKGENMSEK